MSRSRLRTDREPAAREADPRDAGGELEAPAPTGGDAADGAAPSPPVKVVYIAGIGRSGSTLLARALGAADGLTAVGEAMHFFGRGLINNEICGCGRPVRDCRLWGRVAERLGHLDAPLPSSRLERLRDRMTEGLRLPALFLPVRPSWYERRLRDYRRHLSRLYGALRRVSGARAIVDSSKNAGYARILRDAPGVALHVVHLVRDSRGVVHSLQKRKERPGVPWSHGEELLDRRGPATAALFWSAAQLLVESMRGRTSSYVRVRYRDFVRAPADTVRTVLDRAGELEGARQLRHVRGRTVELEPQHVLAGNPAREERGAVRLEEDVAWRRELGPGTRSLVTGLTLPLLRRYGYLRSDDGPPAAEEAGARSRSTVAARGRGAG